VAITEGKKELSRRLDADLLTEDEIEALIRACSRRAPTGVRNRAIIALAWRSGLRIGEVLALQVKDVDLDAGTLVVQRGKGDKRRVVGLDAGTAALVSGWLSCGESVASVASSASSARWQAARSIRRTFVICYRALLREQESKSEYMRMACAMHSRSVSSAKERPSPSSATSSGTQALRSLTGTCVGLALPKLSTSRGREAGLGSKPVHGRRVRPLPCTRANLAHFTQAQD
jgi:Phage integrase family